MLMIVFYDGSFLFVFELVLCAAVLQCTFPLNICFMAINESNLAAAKVGIYLLSD